MRTNPEAAAHMREAAKIARFDAHLYEVAFIDHADAGAPVDRRGVAAAALGVEVHDSRSTPGSRGVSSR